MIAAVDFRILPEDHLHVVEAVRAELAARDRGAGFAGIARLRIGKIDEAVLGEVRIERHVEQAALTLGDHLRHAIQRLRHLAVFVDDAQPSRPSR